MEYLKTRGLTAATIKKWQIGYAPGPPVGGWRDLKTHLKGKGYTDAVLHKAGLIKSAPNGKEAYDVFRDRVMFPMRDPGGRVVAFSGRLLAKDTDAPKYVNSPETELYHKSKFLFGYDLAKHGIRKFDCSLIVEGQFDVVLCHQAGYTNTVAVSGTALTADHVALLERLSPRVILALDADRAGVAAMKKAATIMLARGLDVKVAVLPTGKDPADLLAESPAVFKNSVKNATHVIEFLLEHLFATVPDERKRKLLLRSDVLPYVLLIDNRIDREHFSTVIAERMRVSNEAIGYELERLASEAPAVRATPATITDAYTAPTTPSVSRVAEYAAMLAALQLHFSAAVQQRVHARIEATFGMSLDVIREEVVAAAHDARMTFAMEERLGTLQPNAQREVLVDAVNLLIRSYAEYQLAAARERQDGEEEGLLEDVRKFGTLKQIRVTSAQLFEGGD